MDGLEALFEEINFLRDELCKLREDVNFLKTRHEIDNALKDKVPSMKLFDLSKFDWKGLLVICVILSDCLLDMMDNHLPPLISKILGL